MNINAFSITLDPAATDTDHMIHVSLPETILNELIWYPVTLTKTDITGEKTLPGALIEVSNAQGMANVFYRAGYIENWGRGIEKICKACDELGAERPRYEVLGHGIRVFFKGLESALFHDEAASSRQDVGLDIPISGQVGTLEKKDVPLTGGLESQSAKFDLRPGTLEMSDGTLEKQPDTLELSDDTLASHLIILLRENPQITQNEIVEQLNTSLRTIKRITKRLSEKGIITRKGGKRYGYWEVL